MAEFTVEVTSSFISEWKDALIWLHDHNVEHSQELADRKFLELNQEVKSLKDNLESTPYIGQADEVSGYRRFPLYEGRFLAVWSIDEKAKTVTLFEFLDTKYPKELRYGKTVKFED